MNETQQVRLCAFCRLRAVWGAPRRGADPLWLCAQHKAEFDARLAELDAGWLGREWGQR